MTVECKSEVRADEQRGHLQVADVFDWIGKLPPGAVLTQITRDFGSQRDPDVRSETRISE